MAKKAKKVNKIFHIAKKGQQNSSLRQTKKAQFLQRQVQHSHEPSLEYQRRKASGIVDGNFSYCL